MYFAYFTKRSIRRFMGDNPAEDGKGAVMNDAKNISVNIVIGINDMFGYSTIECSPCDIGIDENEILEKTKGYIELCRTEREDLYKNFKPKQRKASEHERSNYRD